MHKKYLFYIVILVLGVGVSAFSQFDFPTKTPDPTIGTVKDSTLYMVTNVIDGDTIKVDKAGHEETLRLLGINTPETDSPYRTTECWGKEASNETKVKLLRQPVRLEGDPSQAVRDKYNRLLVYVFLADGTNVNQYLVENGFAKEYTYDGVYKYQKVFRVAEDKARAESRGLWSPQNCPR